MPVQLDLFGAPLRPPKKIREDEIPAPETPVTPAVEEPASTPESYVAVIHPKENKQSWHSITTSQPEPPPSLEEENDATGVNEEAAIGQEAFIEETDSEDTDTQAAEETLPEDEPAEDEPEAAATENEPTAEEAIDVSELPTEETETEGVETFTEEEIEEPEEIEASVEEPEAEPIAEEFIDNSADDFIDEEPESFIDEEPAADNGLKEDPEVYTNEETEEPAEEEPETEGVESFSEPATEEDPEEASESAEEPEEDLEEPTSQPVSGEQAITNETVAEEIETEGTESFSEPELPEADEADAVLDDIKNEEEETINEADAQTDPDGIMEEELALEEENISDNITAIAAATTVDEPVGKRGRKPIQDYDEDAGNLNVPPDEDLFKRQYYSMRETAAMFGVNQSLLRFWENEFKILQPKKNKKGDRYFRPVDVKNLVLIYHLLRVRKFTMEGAKEYLQSNKKAGDALELSKRLEKLKSFLLELKASL